MSRPRARRSTSAGSLSPSMSPQSKVPHARRAASRPHAQRSTSMRSQPPSPSQPPVPRAGLSTPPLCARMSTSTRWRPLLTSPLLVPCARRSRPPMPARRSASLRWRPPAQRRTTPQPPVPHAWRLTSPMHAKSARSQRHREAAATCHSRRRSPDARGRAGLRPVPRQSGSWAVWRERLPMRCCAAGASHALPHETSSWLLPPRWCRSGTCGLVRATTSRERLMAGRPRAREGAKPPAVIVPFTTSQRLSPARMDRAARSAHANLPRQRPSLAAQPSHQRGQNPQCMACTRMESGADSRSPLFMTDMRPRDSGL
mmetsp:Transcript_5125/g.14646  ORF Transcript_5125/g.14646 Transcript_5125/m.14646 type:complete len:314 (+) Transcript_5125:455-1396(+)